METTNGEREGIVINNVRANRHYKHVSPGGWESRPMALPPGGHKPVQYRRNSPEFSVDTEMLDGIEVIRHTTRGGVVTFRAPSLNMFSIRKETPGGKREVYTHIVVGEPSRELFEPPSGVSVKMLKEPGGIVYVPKGSRGSDKFK